MQPNSFYYALGRPFSPLYSAAMRLRERLYRRGVLTVHHLGVPVVSVGNLTMGGTGKTPLVQHIARLLQADGFRPAVISRGYGGRAQDRVNLVSDGERLLLDAALAGDEPRLLAETLPGVLVLTGLVRRLPAARAIEMGADVLVLDDGFQHLQMHRDINLVLFNADRLAGNSRVFPGGELREPVVALRRASALVLTGVGPANRERAQLFADLLSSRFAPIPVHATGYEADSLVCLDEQGGLAETDQIAIMNHVWYGFCGIARPASFRRTLEEQGLNLAGFQPLADHQPYTLALAGRIADRAKAAGASALVTTEKDLVKLAPFLAGLRLPVVGIRMRVKSDSALDKNIWAAVRSRQAELACAKTDAGV